MNTPRPAPLHQLCAALLIESKSVYRVTMKTRYTRRVVVATVLISSSPYQNLR